MEMIKTNAFCELSDDEMQKVDGGIWGEAAAIIALLGSAFVGAFAAGRAFIKDVRNKFFK